MKNKIILLYHFYYSKVSFGVTLYYTDASISLKFKSQQQTNINLPIKNRKYFKLFYYAHNNKIHTNEIN